MIRLLYHGRLFLAMLSQAHFSTAHFSGRIQSRGSRESVTREFLLGT